MAIKQCKECGHDVSSDADACPKCGIRLKRRPIGCGGAVLIIIGLSLALHFFNEVRNNLTSAPSVVYDNQTRRSGEIIKVPEKQIAFIQAVQSAKPEYAAAPNELKKSAIRTKRGKLIKSALKESLKVTDWVGKLTRMETNRDGKAIIYIKLEGTDIQVCTWNNALSDFRDDTLIQQESKLYSIIAEMTVGQRVVFSGRFLHDKKDYVKESSIMEESSIADPEFIFKFKAIQSYQSYIKEQENIGIDSSVSRVREIDRDERFIVYSDETVFDTRTNLMWAEEDNGSDINWNDAKIYCKNYRGGGYSDWRMPTQDELASLHDVNKPRSVPQQMLFNIYVATEFIDITGLHIWASETNGLEVARVHFAVRESYWSWGDKSREKDSRILPVREIKIASFQPKKERATIEDSLTKKMPALKKIGNDGPFFAYSNGTVLDTKTNLMWAAKDNGSDINWNDAKIYCENYRGGGYSDWRMPTQDELASLYDGMKSQQNEASPEYPLHLTKLIDVSACCPWASDSHGSLVAFINFNGSRDWYPPTLSINHRVLPVRSSK